MKIKQLPQDVVRKIAAGEVITGTFAIVKELMENASDAGADSVIVEILEGGRSYIKVKDNGCGMTEEEIRTCVLPHTTSKISVVEDLYRISTYGFRGEALSSISQVSKFSITSKTAEDELGTKIDFISGQEIGVKKVNCEVGTTIEVNDLFFNVPARRKFLKTASVEGRMTTEIVEKFILSSDMNIKYTRENQEIYDIKGSMGIKEKIKMIFPELKEHELIEINNEENWVNIHGIISSPTVSRINRTGQIFFVNGRYVKAADVFSSFEAGYGEMLERGRHPYGVVFINVDSAEVDVNVHPQKLEVKFSDQKSVMSLLRKSIRESIQEQNRFVITFNEIEDLTIVNNESPQKEYRDENTYFVENFNKLEIPEEKKTWTPSQPVEETKTFVQNNFSSQSAEKTQETRYTNNNFNNNFQSNYLKPAERKEIQQTLQIPVFNNVYNELSNNKHELFTQNKSYRIVGIVATRYVIVEKDEKMLLIDFHAAHERIIFEKLKKHYLIDGNVASRMLLIPKEINIDSSKYEIIKSHNEALKKLGIILDFTDDKLVVKGLPEGLKINDPEDMLNELGDLMRLEGIESPEKIFEETLATISCRAAVKTGDDVSGIEVLIKELFEMKLVTCPHGRPITMELDFRKIDQYFKRIK